MLPRAGRDPEAAARLLEETADRILRSEFEQVLCLEAPDPVDLPGDLIRADGRSVYRRHGGTRYATRAQLSMEEAMVAQAQARAAPRMTRAAAAAALGADLARLERALAAGPDAESDADAGTGSGLREDQAAAALSVLADGRRVSVINAPAGAGKTRVTGRDLEGVAGGGARPGHRDHRVAVGAQYPGRRAGSSRTTAPVSSATCPAGAGPGATCPSARGPSSRSTRHRCWAPRTWPT